ncbi:FKBP-type peptidyl-prolyl cis-trans isomerase [Sphingobacterium sp. Mn56C]|uniref:FKBP-type peptidyl-prolyl cis-trans isomerase n=1 Tax=Sphingobacterium sp. Mn56C TaxID=3395261 RepID=UPI003BC4C705
MKKLLFLSFAILSTALVATSCSDKDKISYEELLQQDKERVEALLKQQAPILKAYAEKNIPGAKLDTASGIWYKVLAPNTDNSYNFYAANGYIKNFMVTAKYEGRLVKDGAVFDANDKGDVSFTADGIINAWVRAIIPSEQKLNGTIYNMGGLTPLGIKKGGKIRFVAPSPYCYDKYGRGAVIPPDAPLDFTIEVLDIK